MIFYFLKRMLPSACSCAHPGMSSLRSSPYPAPLPVGRLHWHLPQELDLFKKSGVEKSTLLVAPKHVFNH